MKNKKELSRIKRHTRIRMRIASNSERPRLVIKRSLNNIFAQVVDDAMDKIIFSLSTLDKEVKGKFLRSGNVKAAEFFGELFAKRALGKGIKKIIFDRAGYLYHGRVKAFAQALRKGGLEF